MTVTILFNGPPEEAQALSGVIAKYLRSINRNVIESAPGLITTWHPAKDPSPEPEPTVEALLTEHGRCVNALVSREFHPTLASPGLLRRQLIQLDMPMHWLDRMKKALFYGKPLDNAYHETPRLQDFDFTKIHPHTLHGLLGIITEAGELASRLLNMGSASPEPFDDNLQEEFGDIIWFMRLVCDTEGYTIPGVLKKNMNKLYTRFPERLFTSDRAINRNLKAEGEALAGGS